MPPKHRQSVPFFAYLCLVSLAFPLSLTAQIGAMPYISWQSPTANQSFPIGEYVQLLPETGTYDPAHLLIENKQAGWLKFKFGYDPKNLWTPPQNVTLSGNNKLEIVLKDLQGKLDWSKIRIHPQGNANKPIALHEYIKTAQDMGKGWLKVTIPLSDFYAGINFATLSYIEFPYSANAGAFQIAVSSIQFTGGTQIFDWFSQQKNNNMYDGGTAMTAHFVAPKTYKEGIEKVVFQYNDKLLGTDYTYPFGLLWVNPALGTHKLQAIAYQKNSKNSSSEMLSIQIVTDDSAAIAAKAKRNFPFNLPLLVMGRYKPLMAHLQQATLATLPYTNKRKRADLNRPKTKVLPTLQLNTSNKPNSNIVLTSQKAK